MAQSELSIAIGNVCSGPVDRISHRKWRETKQQLILLPDLALCDILSTVQVGNLKPNFKLKLKPQFFY